MTDPIAAITIRRLDQEDVAAVTRLADLDSIPAPKGALLGAEVEGHLLAVVSLTDGTSIADPFSRTAEIRALLELRAAQLRRRQLAAGRRHRLRTDRRVHTRAALAGSVPGAGGRLLTLDD